MRDNIKATDSHFIGSSGEDIIKYYLKQCKIESVSLGTSDFGEDILCDIFTSSKESSINIRTNLSFRIQAKTTTNIETEGYIRRTNNGLSVSISSALIEFWRKSYFPVFLVIWDISANQGYWCNPIESMKENSSLDQDSITIHFDDSNLFPMKIEEIIEQVKKYYERILKLENSKYRCFIYPIMMPRYRLFSFVELLSLSFEEKMKDAECKMLSADLLPTFLTSYNNLNLEGYLSCIKYTKEARSIDEFVLSLKGFLLNLPIKIQKNSWVSFILSPIEIVSTELYRIINEVTDWTCFSKINNMLLSDFDYTFSLSDEYSYTEKMRATSGDQNLFIHKSGKFAVEIFTTRWTSYINKTDFYHKRNVFERSFCLWDISGCLKEEVNELFDWGEKSDCAISFFEDIPNVVLIAHPFFHIGDFGTLLPGMETWDRYDCINYRSEEFISQIPFGKEADELIYQDINKRYFHMISEATNESITSYEQTLNGEALRHDERVIRLICYVSPLSKDFETKFTEVSSTLKKDLQNKFIDFKLYDDPYKDITDVVLEIKPSYDVSTKDIMNIAEPYFTKLLEYLRPFIDNTNDMEYYIGFLLQRWFPKDFVIKD